LILDIDKWGEEAREFLQALRSEMKDLRFILLTANVSKWQELAEVLAPCEIVEKPLSVWSLHSLAAKAHSGGIEKIVSQREPQKAEEPPLTAAESSAAPHRGYLS
jgi:CO dehydrogenase/acetyl-CoA synthase gamma subunit (corrinoid Fe-S protein)